MHKGSANTGTIIFIVLFLLMTLLAGYLFFFGGRLSAVSAPLGAVADAGVRLTFSHPVYGYSLSLPYDWKGKYRVVETGGETQFWYDGQPGGDDPLFSIRRLPAGTEASSSDIKRLGAAGGFAYIMNIPVWTTEAETAQNAKMRRDIFGAAGSFTLPDNGPGVKIKEKLAGLSFGSSPVSGISFISFETLATEERATSSVYFIWFSMRNFSWDSGRLRDWPAAGGPTAVVIAKDTGEVFSLAIPPSGKNFSQEAKKIFPPSVLGSPVFAPDTIEHSALLDKLASELGQAVTGYFGVEPVLIRAGIVSNVVGTASPAILVKLADNTTSSSSLKTDKVATAFSAANSMIPLILSVPASFKKGATSTEASTTISILPADLVSIFGQKSTSTWKKKPFWFEIQNGQILRMFPF